MKSSLLNRSDLQWGYRPRSCTHSPRPESRNSQSKGCRSLRCLLDSWSKSQANLKETKSDRLQCKSKGSPEAVLRSQGFAVRACFRMFSSSKKSSFFNTFFEMVRSLARIELAWKCAVIRKRIILPLVWWSRPLDQWQHLRRRPTFHCSPLWFYISSHCHSWFSFLWIPCSYLVSFYS